MTKPTVAPRAAIHQLPPLRSTNQLAAWRGCRICGGACLRFDTVDFNKYCSRDNYYEFGLSGVGVDYWRCFRCGFISTPFFDDWYSTDLARYVYNDDFGKIEREPGSLRPKRLADDFARRLRGCEGARILGYGSAAGAVAGALRERGFALAESYDPSSGAARQDGRFDIVASFGVIERSPDPVAALADMLSMLRPDGCLLFSQVLQPDDILSARGSWWFLAPRNGHVAAFSEHTLVELGRRLGLKLHCGGEFHGFGNAEASDYARIGLDSIGSSFATVRLLAPAQLGDRRIAFPGPDDVWWHPCETDGVWQYRWAGGPKLSWRAEWDAVAVLQVRVPVVREAAPGLVDACHFQIGDIVQAARHSSGELVAEFQVSGRCSDVIELHMPAAVAETPGHAGAEDARRPRRISLAIPLRPEPEWPHR